MQGGGGVGVGGAVVCPPPDWAVQFQAQNRDIVLCSSGQDILFSQSPCHPGKYMGINKWYIHGYSTNVILGVTLNC